MFNLKIILIEKEGINLVRDFRFSEKDSVGRLNAGSCWGLEMISYVLLGAKELEVLFLGCSD